MVTHTCTPLDLEEDEAVLVDTEEALRGTPKDPSPVIILEGVLGTLEPERNVVEFTRREDVHGSSTAKGRDQEETLEENFEGGLETVQREPKRSRRITLTRQK